MKKGILKTILQDFFKLRYVIVWVIIIVLMGAGIVWAVNNYSRDPQGMHLFPGTPVTINDTSILGTCVIVGNNGVSTYFIPSRTAEEFTAFKNAVNSYLGAASPAKLNLSNCPPLICAPGEYLVGTTCTICPANYYCDGQYKIPCLTGTSSGAGQTSYAL